MLPHPLARKLALLVLIKLVVLIVLVRTAASWLPAPRHGGDEIGEALFGTSTAAKTDASSAR